MHDERYYTEGEIQSLISAYTEAQTIKTGTILSAILSMGNTPQRLFIASSYYPPDSPIMGKEFVIDIIKEAGTSRILVLAYTYNNTAVKMYTRQMFADKWNSEWFVK